MTRECLAAHLGGFRLSTHDHRLHDLAVIDPRAERRHEPRPGDGHWRSCNLRLEHSNEVPESLFPSIATLVDRSQQSLGEWANVTTAAFVGQ
jgi:hypothetical protein